MSEVTVEKFTPSAGSKIFWLAVAVISIGSLAGALLNHCPAAWQGFLMASVFLVSISLGSAFVMAVHFATRASWNIVIRRVSEALAEGIMFWAVMFLVVIYGAHHLYEWSHLDVPAVANDPVLQSKRVWLNIEAWVGRSLLYLVVWIVMIKKIIGHSRAQDVDGDPQHTIDARKWSVAFLVFFGLSMPFSSMDWVMSLEPHWFSSIYGVVYFGGSVQAALAVTILLVLYLEKKGIFKDVVNVWHIKDLGTLMFAFSCFWMYTWLSQYILIWYAHLTEETSFYLLRDGTWLWVSILLPILRFAVPFFGIPSQFAKKSRKWMIFICLTVIGAHILDLFWLIMPHKFTEGPNLDALFYILPAIGLLLWAFFNRFARHNTVPVKDPGLQYSIDRHDPELG